MADKAIGELDRAPQISEDSLIPIEEQGTAMAMSGKQFADFAREAAAADVQRAIDAAADAEENANAAKTDADRAEAVRASIVLDEQKMAQAVENASTSAANAAESEAKAKEYMEQAGEIAGGDFVTNTRFESHASRHAKNGEDPLTLDMIGAAPSGFGVGASHTNTTSAVRYQKVNHAEADELTATGIYWFLDNENPFYADGYNSGVAGLLIHLQHTRDNTYAAKQYFIPYNKMGVSNSSGPDCYIVVERTRRNPGSAGWTPIEWRNPPMLLGVEYRTTERYNGKPVYAKLVDFGALPDTTTGTISHNTANVSEIVSCIGRWEYSSEIYTGGTLHSSGQLFAYSWATTTAVCVRTLGKINVSVKFFLKYTKTTD